MAGTCREFWPSNIVLFEFLHLCKTHSFIFLPRTWDWFRSCVTRPSCSTLFTATALSAAGHWLNIHRMRMNLIYEIQCWRTLYANLWESMTGSTVFQPALSRAFSLLLLAYHLGQGKIANSLLLLLHLVLLPFHLFTSVVWGTSQGVSWVYNCLNYCVNLSSVIFAKIKIDRSLSIQTRRSVEIIKREKVSN